MPLTGLHLTSQDGSYETDRNNHVGAAENQGPHYTQPYYDSSIAIGYGYDLIQRVHARAVIDPVTHRRSYTGTAPEIIADLNSVNNALGLQGAQRVTITQADLNLLAKARLNRGKSRKTVHKRINGNSSCFPKE
jgi:hypothetical protein